MTHKDFDVEPSRIYSPQQMEVLREVFTDYCESHNIPPSASGLRDTLAIAILDAAKSTMDVTKIRAATFAEMFEKI